MLSLFALSTLLVARAAAQASSTTSIFVLGADPQPLVASVVGASNGATTLAVGCKPGTDSSDCGFPVSMLLTYGPTLYDASMSADGLAMTQHCDFKNKASPVCTVSVAGYSDSQPVETETLAPSDIHSLAVVITAGLEKLSGGAAPTSAASSTGSAGATPTANTASVTSTTPSAAAHTSNAAAPLGYQMGAPIVGLVGAAFNAWIL